MEQVGQAWQQGQVGQVGRLGRSGGPSGASGATGATGHGPLVPPNADTLRIMAGREAQSQVRSTARASGDTRPCLLPSSCLSSSLWSLGFGYGADVSIARCRRKACENSEVEHPCRGTSKLLPGNFLQFLTSTNVDNTSVS